MFFCTGVDRKNVLGLARKCISYIMTISVFQHSEKVFMSARNDSIGDVLQEFGIKLGRGPLETF